MKIKCVFPQIKYFLINKNAFLSTDGKFNLRPDINKVIFFEYIGNQFIILDNSQKIINKKDFPNIPNNFFVKSFSLSKNFFILIDENKLNLETFIYEQEAIYSFVEQKIIFQAGAIGSRIFDNYVVDGIGKNVISVFGIDGRIFLPSFPLSSIGTWFEGTMESIYQVFEFSAIYKNTLICNLKNGDVFLLNINSTKDYKLLKGTNFPKKLYPKENHSHIYTGLFARHYIEIDVVNGTILKDISIEEELRKIKNVHWFSVGFSVLYGNLFYFLAETNFVGVYNPTLNKIIDYYEFDFDKSKYQQLKGGEENLQVKDGKIYCLDTLGNLYELELENFLPRFVSSRTANENKKMN